MEFLQYLEGKQLAREGRTDDFLDGETLVTAYCCRVCNSGRRGSVFVVDVVEMGYERREDVWWEAQVCVLEKDSGEREV